MLPFSNTHGTKCLATVEIAITVVAAVGLSILLHQRGILDPSTILAVILVLVGIIPNRIAALRSRSQPHATALATQRHSTR